MKGANIRIQTFFDDLAAALKRGDPDALAGLLYDGCSCEFPMGDEVAFTIKDCVRFDAGGWQVAVAERRYRAGAMVAERELSYLLVERDGLRIVDVSPHHTPVAAAG